MKRKKGTECDAKPSHMQKRQTFFPVGLHSWLSWYHSCTTTSSPTTTLVGLSDFYSPGRAQGFLDIAIDGELTSSESSDHEETGADTRVGSAETELLGNLDQTGSGSLSGKTLALVNLRQHSVGGLGDNGGGETGDETGGQVVDGLHARRGLGLVDNLVNGLVDLLEDDELGHGVWDPIAG
jgi:hypothetical protein